MLIRGCEIKFLGTSDEDSYIYIAIVNKDNKVIWESSYHDGDAREANRVSQEIRKELVLDGIDLSDIENVEEDCIYDWNIKP